MSKRGIIYSLWSLCFLKMKKFNSENSQLCCVQTMLLLSIFSPVKLLSNVYWAFIQSIPSVSELLFHVSISLFLDRAAFHWILLECAAFQMIFSNLSLNSLIHSLFLIIFP